MNVDEELESLNNAKRPVDRLVMHYVKGTHDKTTVCGIKIFSATEVAAGAINSNFCRVLGQTNDYKITCTDCLSA